MSNSWVTSLEMGSSDAIEIGDIVILKNNKDEGYYQKEVKEQTHLEVIDILPWESGKTAVKFKTPHDESFGIRMINNFKKVS
jgi:isocitrate dehydrogenase